MKLFKSIFLLLILCITVSSCSKMYIGFEKRKYRTGYYVDISSIHKERSALLNASKRIIHCKEINNISMPVNADERINPSFIEQENANVNISFVQRENYTLNKDIPIQGDSTSKQNTPLEKLKSNTKGEEWNEHAIMSLQLSIIGSLAWFFIGIILSSTGTGLLWLLCLMILGIIAVIIGVIAISEFVKKHGQKGVGLAIFGILLGIGMAIFGYIGFIVLSGDM